ncbi:hypothetical protein FLLO111716_13495 [Flavobacterium longum]
MGKKMDKANFIFAGDIYFLTLNEQLWRFSMYCFRFR